MPFLAELITLAGLSKKWRNKGFLESVIRPFAINVNYLTFAPCWVMRSNDNGTQSWVEDSNRSSGRAVQTVKGHAISPDGSPAFDHYERPSRYRRQRWQWLVGSDGLIDTDWEKDHIQG